MYSGTNGFDSIEPWVAFRQSQYGYGIINVINSTHLQWEQKNSGGEKV